MPESYETRRMTVEIAREGDDVIATATDRIGDVVAYVETTGSDERVVLEALVPGMAEHAKQGVASAADRATQAPVLSLHRGSRRDGPPANGRAAA